MSTEKTKIISGLFWKVLENGGSQGVQFIVSILLARLLSPKEYSIIALITIFITIANVLVQNGFATSLIQKKEADTIDFSSVLCLSLVTASIVYLLIFCLAPWIAIFYQKPILKSVLRITSITMFPGAVISVQNAYVSKKMEFRSLFLSTLLAAILSGGISIFIASYGMGVWALVWQQILYYFILMITLFITVDWKPRFICDMTRLQGLFAFGWKILIASLIDTIFNNMQGLVMGRIYNEKTLGNYNRGEQFPKIIVLNISMAIQSVMLPVMSAKQDNKIEIRGILRRSIIMSSYLVLPMMIGMIAVANNLIYWLLGEQWSGAVIFLQLMCLAYIFWPIHIANLQALNAMGRSDIFLKLEIAKKIVGLIAFFIGIMQGAIILITMKALADFLCTFINAYPNKKLLQYSIWEQWRDILPSIFISVLMGIAVYLVGTYMKMGFMALLVQVLVGIVVFILLSMITKNESFLILKDLVWKKK